MFGIVEVGSLGDYSFVIIVTKNHRAEYLYSKKQKMIHGNFRGDILKNKRRHMKPQLES